MASGVNRKPVGFSLLTYGFIVVWLIVAAFPFIWTFWGSFKVELDFFSIADWTNSIFGRRTEMTYGTPFTMAGYEGAWIKKEFWRSVINTGPSNPQYWALILLMHLLSLNTLYLKHNLY